jgi:dihydrodipicolinate synthase/N-acetylneuraminate lyase
MTTSLASGVHCVMATPFLPDESLDEASLETLIEYLVRAGCAGILILGVLGEADKLSDAERERLIARSLALSDGRLQVSVGITHGATTVARDRARACASAGAAAVMVSPPPGSMAGPLLTEHFRRIADGLPIPVIIQDHPASSGVRLPVEFMAALFGHLPPHSVVKLEDPPTAGTNRDKARDLFTAALPLLVFEAQPGVGLRKELLKRRGAIAHATVRQPAAKPDAFSLQLLDELLANVPIPVMR